MNTSIAFLPNVLHSFIRLLTFVFLTLTGASQAFEPGVFRDPESLWEVNPSAQWKNVIVVTHGWNPDDDKNIYAKPLWNNLRHDLADAVRGTDWRVVLYDWHRDAFADRPGAEIDLLGFNLAALNGDEHGGYMANILAEKCPDLRQIHYISHSAGSWVSRRSLLNTVAANPFLVGQMTLLDAFVPGDLPNDPKYLNARRLNRTLMSQLPSMGLGNRLFKLDNYFVTDSQTLYWATQASFNWRVGTDLGNIQIDRNNDPYGNQAGGDHSSPLLFYSDSVEVGDHVQRNGSPLGFVPSGGAGSRLSSIESPSGSLYDSRSLGWFQSLFYQRNTRPYFTNQLPSARTITRGNSLLLFVGAQNTTSYKWWFKGDGGSWMTLPSTASAITWTSASQVLSGEYVVEITGANGVLYSNICRVSIVDPPPVPSDPMSRSNPILTSISPATFSNPVQTLTLKGSNFLPSDVLEISGPNGIIYSSTTYPERFTWLSSNRIDYRINIGSIVGSWNIRVAATANSTASVNRSFIVEVPPPVAPPTATTGSLQVNLSPSSAVGAQWSVSGRVSRNSGETEPGLPPGTATVRFTPVSGYITPADRTVTITAGNTAGTSATYTAVAPANYTLTLNSVNGAIGRNPDASNYPAGTVVRIWASANSGYHFVNWSGDLSGSSTVADIVMTGNKNITANFAAGDWSKTSLAVSILPADVLTLGAQWRVDGGPWQNSGVIIPDQHLGDNLVEFREVPGWYRPTTQRIILQGGQPAVISGTYTRDVTPGILQVAINPPDAAAAGGQWQVNGR